MTSFDHLLHQQAFPAATICYPLLPLLPASEGQHPYWQPCLPNLENHLWSVKPPYIMPATWMKFKKLPLHPCIPTQWIISQCGWIGYHWVGCIHFSLFSSFSTKNMVDSKLFDWKSIPCGKPSTALLISSGIMGPIMWEAAAINHWWTQSWQMLLPILCKQ